MAVPYAPPRWPAAGSTLVLWALAAASIVFWGLRLAAPAGVVAPAAVASGAQATVDAGAVARLLGVRERQPEVVATPDAASRFNLVGVVADADQQGAALIAVDGQPPRPFRVGTSLADGYVLQSVNARSAEVGARVDGPPAFTLRLPVLPLADNPPRQDLAPAPEASRPG